MSLRPVSAGVVVTWLITSGLVAMAAFAQSSSPQNSDSPAVKARSDITPPRAIYDPQPEYPEDARIARHQGTCVVSLIVGVDGKPRNLSVVRKAGMGLDEKAIEAVSTWIFQPAARKNGTPVAVPLQVEVDFILAKEKKLEAEDIARIKSHINRIPDDSSPRICGPLPANRPPSTPTPLASIHLDDSSQYRLARITFSNNRAFTNLKALRVQFPLKDGDPYNESLVAQGLDNLRSAYATIGYIDFTAQPQPAIDRAAHTISLNIAEDEGEQFFVSRIDIMGLGEPAVQNIRDDMFAKPGNVRPGDVYNQRLVNIFLKDHAILVAHHVPHNPSTEPALRLQRSAGNGTVAITYDFRACGAK